jgi:hypothetical protein
VEDLQILWLGAGIITPIKVLMAVILMVTLGYQVLKVLPTYREHVEENELRELQD